MTIDRRALMKQAATGAAGVALVSRPAIAQGGAEPQAGVGEPGGLYPGARDRAYMLALLEKMATPVLSRMAEGQLQRTWTPELSPSWDGRNAKVAYLEAFGRLIDGLAPWLALSEDASPEGRLRARIRDWALASYAHSVDPDSPDRVLWEGEGQALVDSAYFTSALIRAPKALWEPLDARTKQRIVGVIKGLRRVAPPYTNWLLFAAMNEAFLLLVGEEWDPVRLDLALRKFGEWYVGDGWYGDGDAFHFDMYNSYVIHPMLSQILDVLVQTGARFNALDVPGRARLERERMQRFCVALERMIGPDGAFPPVGRSLTYRTAVHQPLAYLAWRKELPEKLPEGQVRAACLATQRRIFEDPSNFNADGFLTIGFARHQPSLGDVYSNAGSMYITSESLLALGLASQDSFWTCAPEAWTMMKAYRGSDFTKDHYIDV
ncbi:DUF2264 domain-containing protein [Novosphingobium sp. 1949]|uniref:DUF2264 domain-containing protein n=1 Tax=Novosphingobium organovorum TaxID=2930092 RepID=A0ABT0BCR8_9SPHN|nr:DUF2264 domain-containing protein [Novosphingobium organovorum]MCJ2182875.1 DUF2264 domain-containing protein [Novosphingobium organovorum]